MKSGSKEINLDGLVGPTHNYSGLSYGNTASTLNQRSPANPREAALQGLEKMKFLSDLGFVQVVLPPHERPYLPLLRQLGYRGKDADIWECVAREAPELISACSSAAAMWAANAATISPSCDSLDKRVHFTPANLVAKLHRSIEPAATHTILETLFKHPRHFIHHPPLPAGVYFADEGAANHSRFCADYGSPGVQLFVWGKSMLQSRYAEPIKFPARQTLEASQAIARRHRLDGNAVVFAQQNPHAIDAGVFHNDVIAIGNQALFLFHEEAFVSQERVLDELKDKVQQTCGGPLALIQVRSDQISLQQAVSTYLFNSQILTLADGSMMLIAPTECEKNANVCSFLTDLMRDPSNPISQVRYLHLRESMRNGGGPACLRLRVVLSPEELQAMHQEAILDEKLYQSLKEWINKHYRDRLSPQDLTDPCLIEETQTALDALTHILKIGPLYEFQQ